MENLMENPNQENLTMSEADPMEEEKLPEEFNKIPPDDSDDTLPEEKKKIEQEKVSTTWDLVHSLFKDDLGRPFAMTPAQNEIFDCIFKKQSPDGKRRIHIETLTQFGKSDVVSMAVLTRISTYPEKWVIVAPSQSKARIIVGYLIKHIFDNEYTISKFKVKEGESLESVRRERSKNRLTFEVGGGGIGEVFILSAESRLTGSEDVGNALMGFGCIVGGYNVMTDKGNLPIDKVVKEKIPVKVLSYNDRDNIMEFKKIISYQENPLVNRHILEIDLGDKKFQCTNDHPVFVEGKGYIPAEEIKNGDKVLSL